MYFKKAEKELEICNRTWYCLAYNSVAQKEKRKKNGAEEINKTTETLQKLINDIHCKCKTLRKPSMINTNIAHVMVNFIWQFN